MFLDGIAIGHAGDVITNGAVPADSLGAFTGLFADFVRVFQKVMEQILEQLDGPEVGFVNFGIVIEVVVEVIAQFEIELAAGGAVLDDGKGVEADLVGGLELVLAEVFFGGMDDILDLAVDDAANDEIPAAFIGQIAVLMFDPEGGLVPDLAGGGEVLFVDQAGAEAVVEIVAVVGDFVGEIGDLGFEGGGFGVEPFPFTGVIVTGEMFDETFAAFPSEIEAGEGGVFLFEFFDDTQALLVVFEAAVIFHEPVENHFAFVTERGVAEVMGESDGFSEIFVQLEGAGDIAGDGRDFDGVGEASAEMITGAIEEDLSFVFEAAEGAGMDDAIAIALVMGAPFRGFLWIFAAAGVGAELRAGGEGIAFALFEAEAGAGHGQGMSGSGGVGGSKICFMVRNGWKGQRKTLGIYSGSLWGS